MILHIIRTRNRYHTKITSHKDIPWTLSGCQNNPKVAFAYQEILNTYTLIQYVAGHRHYSKPY